MRCFDETFSFMHCFYETRLKVFFQILISRSRSTYCSNLSLELSLCVNAYLHLLHNNFKLLQLFCKLLSPTTTFTIQHSTSQNIQQNTFWCWNKSCWDTMATTIKKQTTLEHKHELSINAIVTTRNTIRRERHILQSWR